jgi:tRNA(Ile)-lysidine synthase
METLPLAPAFAAAWPVDRWRDLTVVVGVSGGADSVALLRVMAAMRELAVADRGESSEVAGGLVAVHVNHRLRGAASDEDARFVAELCASLGVECVVGTVEPRAIADEQGDGLEAACRTARYDFLLSKAERLGARYVAVAHTADDQAETVLHHVLRGTGLAGLAGMAMFRAMSDAVTLVRPLLAVRRVDVLAYLESLGQSYREDETNRQREFTRNRIRCELLPLLARDYSADVVPALVRLGQHAREAHEVVCLAAEALAGRCVREQSGKDEGETLAVDCRLLAGVNRHVVREMFVALWRRRSWPRQAMRFADWDDLAEMALGEDSETNRTFPGEVAASRNAGVLTLRRHPQRKPLPSAL